MSQEAAFEILESGIYDENRTITYKILSGELGIHVNKAKQYLYEFFNDRNSKSSNELTAYYFLAGFQEDAKGCKVVSILVAPYDKIDEAKKKFSLLTSCHIYSINKGKLVNESTLYLADRVQSHNDQAIYSSIRNTSVSTQQSVLSRVHVKESAPAAVLPKALKKELPPKNKDSQSKRSDPKNFFAKSSTEESASSGEIIETAPSKVENKEKKSPQEKPKNAISSLPNKKEEKQPGKASKGKKKTQQESSKNLMSMFSKQAAKQTSKVNVRVVQEKPIPAKEEIKEESKLPAKVVEKHHSSPKRTKATNNAQSKKQKRTSQSKKKSSKVSSDSESADEFKPQKKKRKRIMIEESASESECEEEKDKAQRALCSTEDPMEIETPMDDDEDPIPPTPEMHRGKMKMWKTVTKTFEDNDGFLVTKKGKEFVSASEESDCEDPLKPVSKKTIKKDEASKISAANKKQASLTSFFKQK